VVFYPGLGLVLCLDEVFIEEKFGLCIVISFLRNLFRRDHIRPYVLKILLLLDHHFTSLFFLVLVGKCLGQLADNFRVQIWVGFYC